MTCSGGSPRSSSRDAATSYGALVVPSSTTSRSRPPTTRSINVLDKLDDFRGLSRFTTWAYKFVMFEVSAKVARHAWRRQSPSSEELEWDQLPDVLGLRPDDWLEQRARLDALSQAIGELTDRQREVLVSVALNDVPIDVLAVKLGTNRNAVYKNLFDARRRLRAIMATAGHPWRRGRVQARARPVR